MNQWKTTEFHRDWKDSPLPKNHKLKTTTKQEQVSSLKMAAEPSRILQPPLPDRSGVWELPGKLSSGNEADGGGITAVEWGCSAIEERETSVTVWERVCVGSELKKKKVHISVKWSESVKFKFQLRVFLFLFAGMVVREMMVVAKRARECFTLIFSTWDKMSSKVNYCFAKINWIEHVWWCIRGIFYHQQWIMKTIS